jgi:hypothetical protein
MKFFSPPAARCARTFYSGGPLPRHKAPQELHAQRHRVHGIHMPPTLVDQADEAVVLGVVQDFEDPPVVELFFLAILEPIQLGPHKDCQRRGLSD